MTDDEKDRALCEAHCNSAADEYFNARPQLDSDVNRRIFYAGHRKAWIERGEAVRLNAQAVPDAPTWEQVQKAWYAIGADVAGLDWSAFVRKVSATAAPAAPQGVPCDCTTEIHADGTRKTWCGSDQMRRATEEGHAFAAAPQPAQPAQPAQPLTDEKDALLRQALEALEGFIHITNDSQGVAGYHLSGDTAEWDEFDEVDAAISAIEAIRQNLGVKND